MSAEKKAYRYRLLPTPEQEEVLRQFAGARRFVWNWALARRKAHSAATGKTLPLRQLYAELTALKDAPGMAWLRQMDSQALQQAIRDLDRAFVTFFEKRAKFPRFKARKRGRPSFRIPQRVRIVEGQLSVPKVGLVK
ncbi:MAG: RNA-guided endonuclease InsQ/TnpB family protein, partial [Oscillochloridaceae bacterium umkhey_bin13]